jgi:hypothetical protein
MQRTGLSFAPKIESDSERYSSHMECTRCVRSSVAIAAVVAVAKCTQRGLTKTLRCLSSHNVSRDAC